MGRGPVHPVPAGALTLVIEEAMAGEDEPAAFPEPEPGAVLGKHSGKGGLSRRGVGRGNVEIKTVTPGDGETQKEERNRHMFAAID